MCVCVCVCVCGGGNQGFITIQTSTIFPLSATVSRKCVGVGVWGGTVVTNAFHSYNAKKKSEKVNATLSVCIINRCVLWQTVQFLIRTRL